MPNTSGIPGNICSDSPEQGYKTTEFVLISFIKPDVRKTLNNVTRCKLNIHSQLASNPSGFAAWSSKRIDPCSRYVQLAAEKVLAIGRRRRSARRNTCMGNLLSLGAKMCIWNLTEGRSRNCDFKCKLGTHFCGFGLYSCSAILHAMCFQFCLHRDIHKKCIPILI